MNFCKIWHFCIVSAKTSIIYEAFFFFFVTTRPCVAVTVRNTWAVEFCHTLPAATIFEKVQMDEAVAMSTNTERELHHWLLANYSLALVFAFSTHIYSWQALEKNGLKNSVWNKFNRTYPHLKYMLWKCVGLPSSTHNCHLLKKFLFTHLSSTCAWCCGFHVWYFTSKVCGLVLYPYTKFCNFNMWVLFVTWWRKYTPCSKEEDNGTQHK